MEWYVRINNIGEILCLAKSKRLGANGPAGNETVNNNDNMKTWKQNNENNNNQKCVEGWLIGGVEGEHDFPRAESDQLPTRRSFSFRT